MTSPVPSNPASWRGVSVVVALCTTALPTAFKAFARCSGEIRRTSGLAASCESRPMKHAILVSDGAFSAGKRWSKPVAYIPAVGNEVKETSSNAPKKR